MDESHCDSFLKLEKYTFNHEQSYLDDVVSFIIKNNKKKFQTNRWYLEIKRNTHVARFTFLLCEHLNLSREAAYLALEIVAHFVGIHMMQMKTYILDGRKSKGRWHAIVARVTEQLPMRVMTCIQLASKLLCNNCTVQLRDARDTLRRFSVTVDKENLLQSELRVLRTLDYHVSHGNAYSYLDVLTQLAAHHMSMRQLPLRLQTATRVLDFVHLNWNQVFDTLCGCVGDGSKSGRRHPQRIDLEKNLLLLSAACLITSEFLLHHPDGGDEPIRLAELIAQNTKFFLNDLLDFVTVLLRLLQTYMTSSASTTSPSSESLNNLTLNRLMRASSNSQTSSPAVSHGWSF